MKMILCEDTPISNTHFLLVAPIKRHTGSTSCVTVQHYLKQSHIMSLQTSVTGLDTTVVVRVMTELVLVISRWFIGLGHHDWISTRQNMVFQY